MSNHKKNFLHLLLAPFLFALSINMASANEKYTVVRSVGPVCSVAAQYLYNYSSFNRTLVEEPGRFKNDLDEFKNNPELFHLPSGMTASPYVDFDFDNDGILDRIFAYDGAGSYIRGSIWFVAFGKSKENSNQKIPLTVDDVKVFPCQFDPSVHNSNSCPMISQAADDGGIKVSFSDEKSVFFRGRYTYISPIRYKGRTYLTLGTSSADTEKYSAVIEPIGGTRYRSVCLFKRLRK